MNRLFSLGLILLFLTANLPAQTTEAPVPSSALETPTARVPLAVTRFWFPFPYADIDAYLKSAQN